MKSIAYREVRSAIKSGRLVRPARCEACGNVPPPAKDGRSNIQAHHHEGYDKPLSVQWLCIRCHMAVTPNLNTSNQNKVKTHCLRGHPLSGDNLYPHPLWRVCRTCCQEKSLARYHKGRALAKET